MTAERSRQMDRMGRGTKGAEVWYDEHEMQAKPETIAPEQRNDDRSTEGLDDG
jgi:hypothetical protein